MQMCRFFIWMFLSVASVPVASAADALAGKAIFDKVCAYCHAVDGSEKIGPSLAGIGERRDAAWLHSWLMNPNEMIKNDVNAKLVRGNSKYNMTMPAIPLMKDEAKRADVIAYLLENF